MLVLLRLLFSSHARRASSAMRVVSRRLEGRTHDGVRVAEAFHYGAVGIDPTALVVWLMLDGRPVDELPEWLDPRSASSADLRSVDHSWLLELRAEVCDAFQAVGWPDAHAIDVLVDSDERARAAGGWNYFR